MEAKVSRSAYQKVCEENKKLTKDIFLLVEDGIPSAEKILCLSKWRNKIAKDKMFQEQIKVVAKQYIQDNKDSLPDFLTTPRGTKN